jgi:DNA-binding NarL/FixJ family response regulator
LILHDNDSANTAAGRPLTPTQIKVLRLILEGHSNREIAEMLKRSVRTIEVHRAHVMEKLGVKNMLELTKRAIALGLVDLPANQNAEKT